MEPPHKRTLSRREMIRYTLAGMAGVAGAGGIAWYLVRAVRREAPGVIFAGQAPRDEVWALWRKRGWAKEGYHYLKLGRNVQCKLCPNNCILSPGDRSHCRNRINRDGTLYTLAYGNPCSFHVDPVEKKPLFHFLPGTQTFSLATAGCVFRCLNCQNWEISQKTPEETKDATGPEFRFQYSLLPPRTMEEMRRCSMFPADVVKVSKELGCPSISYTYSEPVAFYEYTQDTCKLARAEKLRNIMVTCGSIEEAALRDIAQYLDAAHVDLKGFDEEIYWELNTGKLQPVLNTLKTLHGMGVWFEIINLVVPTYTDHLETIKRMSGWLAQNIGPDHPLHFSRFHPAHKLEHLSPTPVETLLRARELAMAEGLHYVYVGNVLGVPGVENTFCPGCKRAIIERELFAIKRLDVVEGKCRHCQTKIAGVWR
jgi:pyruvate formate lyase activating enzyme